jgi:hypothetical protein
LAAWFAGGFMGHIHQALSSFTIQDMALVWDNAPATWTFCLCAWNTTEAGLVFMG